MTKVTLQHKQMFEEIERTRGRVITCESTDLRMQEKMSELFTTTLIHTNKLETTEKWNTQLQNQIDEAVLMASKVKEIGERQERIQTVQTKIEL